ncbi:MAG: ATPase [Cellvibrionaceae bacterium]|nr:ATPase [Cellvibrionaceae bacterium]
MSESPPKNTLLYAGIDGGGTKCQVTLTDSNLKPLASARGGPANPYQDMATAKHAIETTLAAALDKAGLNRSAMSQVVIGMGLAGVNIREIHQAMCAWQLPCAKHFVTTDMHIANTAAHSAPNGAVIVIGTGTSGFCEVDGRTLSLGGHGYPLGDKGSGCWLGISAIQATLLAEDKLGPKTQLAPMVLEALQARTSLDLVAKLNNAKQRDFAALAPLVFSAAENEDAVAKNIIREGAEYLAGLAQRLLDFGAPRISAIGGLSKKMLPNIKSDLAQKFQPALEAPEMGAAIFARKQFKAMLSDPK